MGDFLPDSEKVVTVDLIHHKQELSYIPVTPKT